jgi:chorismate dehydratase
MTVRIGCVQYLNTLPLIEGLQGTEGLALRAAVPARLGDLLAQGEIDIALASLIDYARAPEPLTLLPAGMIGCDGPTLTVRLFSAVPMERVTRVHADTDSHTSVALAQVLLARKWGLRPEVIDYDARGHHEPTDPWPETLLLIGDKVVTDSPPAVRYPHQLDLGEVWHEMTGLPFVYAMWMARRADLGGPRGGEIKAAAATLDRQRRRNTMRLDWVVDRYAHERRWPADLARTYVRDYLVYDVDERAKEGAARFLAEAAGLGLCPRVEPVYAEA